MANQMSLALQGGAGNQQVSGLAVTVAIHAAIGAALLFGLTRPFVDHKTPPPVVVLPPQLKPTPVEPLHRTPKPVMQRVIVELPPLPDIKSEVPRKPNSDQLDDPAVVPAIPAGDGKVAGGNDGRIQTPLAGTGEVNMACPNARDVRASIPYPVMARRAGVQGDVVARFIVDPQGSIRNIAIISSSSALLNRTVQTAIADFRCVGQGRDVAVEVPFSFRLVD